MSIHVMLILLTFKAPIPAEPLELLEAPQIVAPMSLLEATTPYQEWHEAFKKAKEPV